MSSGIWVRVHLSIGDSFCYKEKRVNFAFGNRSECFGKLKKMDVGVDAAEMVVDVIWCNSIEYGRTNSYQTSYHNCSETVSEASEMMIFEKFNDEEY